MPHGNAVINGNGIELGSVATHFLYLLTDYLSYLMQVRMAWNKLSERVDNGNDGFTELFLFHTRGNP
jgi:hypothetical protein